MITKTKLAGAALAALMSAGAMPAAAADYSFTGNLGNPNDVALFNFTVGSTSNVTLRTYSYAGGTNAAGQVFGNGGFDPILALFDSTGLRINQNDDGGADVAADPINGRRYDTFLSSLLAPGSYTVSVMAYSNFSAGPNLSDGFQGGGNFQGRSSFYAFDVLGADQATGPGAVPEPSTWALLILGFGAVGAGMRRRTASGVATRAALRFA